MRVRRKLKPVEPFSEERWRYSIDATAIYRLRDARSMTSGYHWEAASAARGYCLDRVEQDWMDESRYTQLKRAAERVAAQMVSLDPGREPPPVCPSCSMTTRDVRTLGGGVHRIVEGYQCTHGQYCPHVAPTQCPYCGAWGIDFEEADMPSDYCGHDPALMRPRPV